MSATQTTPPRRRACVECFQRKVRCEWQEDLNVCVRCQRNQLECKIPTNSQAPLRNPIRDVISALDKRLSGIETSASSTEQSKAPQPAGLAMEATKEPFQKTSSHLTSLEPSLPWRMLASDTSDSPNLLTRVRSLADEELTMKVSSHKISYDILKEFPMLSKEDVIMMARAFAFESPFAFMYWPSVRDDLYTFLEHKSAASASHLACILMHLAFGASLLEHVSRHYSPALFFTEALNLLPQLMLHQSIPALKALTLIVHYLQASYHPTQCYTMLGAASHLAISLGVHKLSNLGSNTPDIERQEGLRAWWLCYIMQRTLAVIYDMPMMDFSVAVNSSLPELFQAPETSIMNDAEIMEIKRNDEETVALFLDVISMIQRRDSILACKENDSNPATPLRVTLADVFQSRLQDANQKSRVKSNVRELVRLNSIIVIDHKFRAPSASEEAISAAVKTIQLIEASQNEGLVMCLWMWLYYAFTAVAVLFSHLLRRPLGPDATFHLALISDTHEICSNFAAVSPAAMRIHDITRTMDIVGFKLIKSVSKKRALERDDNGEGREKRGRTGFETTQDGSFAMAEEPQTSAGNTTVLDDLVSYEGLPELPADFNWEDWETWFQDTSSYFSG